MINKQVTDQISNLDLSDLEFKYIRAKMRALEKKDGVCSESGLVLPEKLSSNEETVVEQSKNSEKTDNQAWFLIPMICNFFNFLCMVELFLLLIDLNLQNPSFSQLILGYQILI